MGRGRTIDSQSRETGCVEYPFATVSREGGRKGGWEEGEGMGGREGRDDCYGTTIFR